MVTLETQTDRDGETYTMLRLWEHYGYARLGRNAAFSECDYAVYDEYGEVVEYIEVKNRKEGHFASTFKDGVILKVAKVQDLCELSERTGKPVSVVFAFRSGQGAIFRVDPRGLGYLTPVAPPERRIYRGLECDDDPVYMVPLIRMQRVLDPEPIEWSE